MVVDTNILVSFFRENPVKSILSNSKSLNLQLFTSTYVIQELEKNKSDILKYSKLNSEQFNLKLSELLTFIEIVSESSCKGFKSHAEKLIHGKDIPVFALALKLNCPIWSNEPAFKEQSKVEILSNKDMIELFE
ncbi:MAG: PIN domain-containing protein [Nanoarchaeota archaeon]|nr:PIN domain-containing protein [Nanoarchaeota archaeon]